MGVFSLDAAHAPVNSTSLSGVGPLLEEFVTFLLGLDPTSSSQLVHGIPATRIGFSLVKCPVANPMRFTKKSEQALGKSDVTSSTGEMAQRSNNNNNRH